ncbi:hypothetical protein E4S40_00395 [Algoriphagus kandeliae]|uniref:Uncharacterized protein n=1 Tax=Algoriphagus kandeliae TaxID=2562278 RepID=A0A4Y9QXT4_9BACT|nr:hypothetical protein [Algoriphagus kandeliae]TFV97149.1 hypothetical protein E4S40_00395 [Algoriphagus kandeliae]
MNVQQFKRLEQPDPSFSPELLALWWDFHGNWDMAHSQVDHLSGKLSARVHAYLHRKEGDLWNADYWYRIAGEERPTYSLDREWEELLERLL